MKKYQVLYTADAYRDLQGIHRYIAVELQEKTVAKMQMARIKKAILSLCALPERHGGVDWEPWSSMGVRRLLHGGPTKSPCLCDPRRVRR